MSNTCDINTSPDHTPAVSECSLTAPCDRVKDGWKPTSGASALTDDETGEAMTALNNTQPFPRVDRVFADPPVSMQRISLFSFIPATGAVPNKYGIYGYGKIRGGFDTTREADARAEYIIRNVDSFNTIHHTPTGRPFPLTTRDDLSDETVQVDIQRDTTRAISNNIRKKKRKEGEVAREMSARESQLRAECDVDVDNLTDDERLDKYITVHVRTATLKHAFLETLERLVEIRESIVKGNREIETLDAEDASHRDVFFEKFVRVRKEHGFVDDDETIKTSFVRFMVNDLPIPTIDTAETIPVSSRSVERDD
jgi:hypothetical protein